MLLSMWVDLPDLANHESVRICKTGHVQPCDWVGLTCPTMGVDHL